MKVHTISLKDMAGGLSSFQFDRKQILGSIAMGICAGILTEPPPPPPPPEKSVLDQPSSDVRAAYTIGKELGRGQFAVTHICTHRLTGRQFACKTIAKRKLVTPADMADVQQEVAIMKHLAGTPSVVRLEEAFEDKVAVHLVMELCAGGELFDRIVAQGKYTERAAAAVCRSIVQTIHACHERGVMHRDIKPENFLFLNRRADSPLKVADFGVAVFFKEGETFSDAVGSAYYIAPEVLDHNYSSEADIWSAGVILYILLSGLPPFSPYSDKEEDIWNAIQECKIDLTSSPWPSISDSAKDLVTKMLTKNPAQRLKAREILTHPWIRIDGAPDILLDNIVFTNMKQFRAMNKLKKVALKVIASSLSEEDIKGLKSIFEAMDTDKNGKITFEELTKGLAQQGYHLAETEIQQLMQAADVDQSGSMDYTEFITATANMNKIVKEDQLFEAFQFFDRDKSGFITKEELETALTEHNMMDEGAIREIMEEADKNKDGLIDYEEFAEMMGRGKPTWRNRKHILPTIK